MATPRSLLVQKITHLTVALEEINVRRDNVPDATPFRAQSGKCAPN